MMYRAEDVALSATDRTSTCPDESGGRLTAAAVKSRSLAVILSGSVSFPLSISSFITLGSSRTAMFSDEGKRRSRTAMR